MKTPLQVKDGINKIKKVVERFHRDFNGKMPQDIGVICMLAIIKDKQIFIESVKYHAIELGLNIENIEKSVIYQNLARKYSLKDKEDRKEQKKLIKKQVKDMKKKKKKTY